MTYKVYLSTRVNTAKLKKGSGIIVLEPGDYKDADIKAIRAKGYKVLAYLSIGTIEKERSWYNDDWTHVCTKLNIQIDEYDCGFTGLLPICPIEREPMRLIDADALEKYLSDAEIEATRQRKYVFASALNTICGNVRNFPTIKSERKKGKWIHNDSWVNTCSECGMGWNRAFLSDQWNFCPNCGSCNGGEQDED